MANLDFYANCLVAVPPVIGVLFAMYEAIWVASIKVEAPGGGDLKEAMVSHEEGEDRVKSVQMMKQVAALIADGATTFLYQEYKYLAVYVVVFSCIIGPFVDLCTMIAFVIGCVTSCLCGFIGMKIAVFANVRTTSQAWKDLAPAFDVALNAGSVMGFTLVSLGLFILWGLIHIYTMDFVGFNGSYEHLFESIAGYGLGGSSIALFARVGGGIYTKAADVGADLSGKNDCGIDEDDPRNPACIADNVGDNVGDIAGMGADLFGSLAESTCATLVIAGASQHKVAGAIADSWAGLMFPLMITGTGIIVGLVTMLLVKFIFPVKTFADIEKALKGVLIISTILMTPTVVALAYYFLPASFGLDEKLSSIPWYYTAISVGMGLWSGLIIGYITEYYTSHSYVPVRSISRTQMTSAATGIIAGLALGYMSTIVPVFCLGATVLVAHSLCGMYGVALSALGMLGTLTMALAIDAYGPISDNAGGIAEMSMLGHHVRQRTDALDAAGNTTAAIGKGFAIGSAALVSLALFGAFTVRAKVEFVDILDPWVFTGLLYGAMMPYAFSAMTMKSVGEAADQMVQECKAQFPKIMRGEEEPQYARCIQISTDASLKEMIAPGALVILSPLVAGALFGKNCTAGLLAGALVSGINLAISASNSGGAWDNAKKYIEAGHLGDTHKKGSDTHKNAVTGDTVGDPLKDTSGPSLNILVKLSAIISLVFGTVIAERFSNKQGGPKWLSA